MYQYKNISTLTVEGIKEAERLQADGWKIIRTGLFYVQFEKWVTKKQK